MALGSTLLFVLIVALLATAPPGRRALRIDPRRTSSEWRKAPVKPSSRSARSPFPSKLSSARTGSAAGRVSTNTGLPKRQNRTETLEARGTSCSRFQEQRPEACGETRASQSGSLVTVHRSFYSVDSRLIGEMVEAGVRPDTVEIWYADRR